MSIKEREEVRLVRELPCRSKREREEARLVRELPCRSKREREIEISTRITVSIREREREKRSEISTRIITSISCELGFLHRIGNCAVICYASRLINRKSSEGAQ
jgi:hypothetical protein